MKKSRKRQKQKKQEVKEDIFVQSVTSLWQKVAAVKAYVIVLVIAVLAAMIVAGFMAERKQTVRDKGWDELAKLEERIGKMDTATEADQEAIEDEWLKGLEELIPQTEGSTVQPVIVFYYADALFRKGGAENVKTSEEQCRFFLEKFPKNYYAVAVKQLLGKTLFEQEKYADALEVFQDVYDISLAEERPEMKGTKYEALYYVGRCHELLGQLEQARNMYEQLASEDVESPQWSEMARFRLSKMKS